MIMTSTSRAGAFRPCSRSTCSIYLEARLLRLPVTSSVSEYVMTLIFVKSQVTAAVTAAGHRLQWTSPNYLPWEIKFWLCWVEGGR